jgi:hypothetical protein
MQLSLRTRPRLAFVGLGWIGRARMQALAGSGLAEIVALADPDPAAVGSVQALAPGAVAAATLDEALAGRPDGVVIATPSARHAAESIAALQAGCAVFCQKPLGRTAAEVRAVVAAAEAADRLLGVDLSYRRTAAMQAIHPAGERWRRWGGCSPWISPFTTPTGRTSRGSTTGRSRAAAADGPWRASRGSGARRLRGCPRNRRRGRPPRQGPAPRRPRARGPRHRHAALPGRRRGPHRVLVEPPRRTDAVIAVDLHGTEGGLSLRNIAGSFTEFEAHHHRGTTTTRIAAPPDDWGGRTAVAWAGALAAGEGFDPAAHRLVTLSETIDRIYRAGFGEAPRLRAAV